MTREVVEPGQALGQLARVGDRGAGEHEARGGPVGVRDPPQPAQHVADVGAEHAAVDVRLVDHHQREVGEEVAPRAVVGQDPQVQHVGVGEDDVGAAADRRRCSAACRRRRSRGAGGRRRTRAARAPGPARAPWPGTGTARAPWRRGTARRASGAGSTATSPTRCRWSRSSGPPTRRAAPRPGGSTAARCRGRAARRRRSGAAPPGARPPCRGGGSGRPTSPAARPRGRSRRSSSQGSMSRTTAMRLRY